MVPSRGQDGDQTAEVNRAGKSAIEDSICKGAQRPPHYPGISRLQPSAMMNGDGGAGTIIRTASRATGDPGGPGVAADGARAPAATNARKQPIIALPRRPPLRPAPAMSASASSMNGA